MPEINLPKPSFSSVSPVLSPELIFYQSPQKRSPEARSLIFSAILKDAKTKLRITMEASEINQMIELSKAIVTPLSGAIGAVAGAFASIIPNRAMARASREEKATSTTYQIYAEIKSILEVERHRKYSELLHHIINELRSGRASEWPLKIEMPDDRFSIYKANLPNLGLLPPKLQLDIVRFYQLTESIIQDIKPGGLFNEALVGIEQYEEVLQMLQKAKAIGTEILAEIESVHRIG